MSALVEEEEEEMPILVEATFKQIPVSIMTGFLGSGKTTLLNYLLRKQHGKRIAIIENEFSGGLGIENMIAKSGVDGGDMGDFFELNNGCICCSVKEDLLTTLEQLVLHKDRFDYVLIETTGVANPGPIITSLWADEALESSLRLDGVITVVDSVNVLKYLQNSETSHDVKMQLAFADRILINKADLVEPQQMDVVEAAVREINSSAEVRRTSYSEISPDWILDSDSYSLTNMNTLQLKTVEKSATASHHDHNHSHDQDGSCNVCDNKSSSHSASTLSTFSFIIEGKMELNKLKICLDQMLYSFDDDNSVHGQIKKEATSKSDNQGVSSSCRIYRMKGVFQVDEGGAGKPSLYLLQAVHDVFDIQKSDVASGSDEDRSEGFNKIIVIGKNMDKSMLEKEFRQCLA